ncbi:uncharacterized protein LOC122756913 [Drosophila mojavensis]|uniref:uncharacterized protein LOC122756913 n=1 Tax=Drosophila mojavensis TaxID=7230 RepID=UPI001CD11C29|nr:uncharacterized protein LOC122756913 [Drosophila mojavensis]
MDVEEIAGSVTLARLAQVDSRLQRMTFASNVRTRYDLQTELKAFTFNKKKMTSREEMSLLDIKSAARRIMFVHVHRLAVFFSNNETESEQEKSGINRKKNYK